MSEACELLHRMTQELRRLRFPFDSGDIPRNGIYVLFQAGETGHNGDRIVRVGTHTGIDQLASRLNQHFLTENKDRSIFRKNIGRAILTRDDDSFLEQWEIDLTSRASREKHSDSIDLDYQGKIEKTVSAYIRQNFSFSVIYMLDKSIRLSNEAKFISTVSHCNQCHSSDTWLGRSSPKAKIRESGLWLVNQLYKTPFEVEEVKDLRVQALG